MASAFRVDDGGDRSAASDGVSRFGVYLERSGFERVEDAASFATSVVRVALPPVMSPGYVWQHPRVQDVSALRGDAGELVFAVSLVSALPAALEPMGRRSLGWERKRSAGQVSWLEPERWDRVALLPSLVVRVPVPVEALPAPRYRADGVPELGASKRAVRVVVAELERVVAPVLAVLEPHGAVA
ncbi:hypothetical protein [Actinosynnema pretiosum]|uniref:Uncharacterized protein n=1 Tax=Actinosynnema pretiosum TaxID=42197 RepID=A0A290Z3Q9_9PSEU|nr:hypothetical protein [Actinosynnema pretiosum]ATE53637.1 hypothetical protein CNX65_10315 [Actinosynnema pretiosum]ATE57482.1 hypothetical protein CNX65_32690 [Actinosynnema pretiosum]